MTYHAFVSYSHAADGKLAPALQHGVQAFARPWYRLRGVHLFRDKTGLAVTPELWAAIERALSESEWFILLASPQSAASAWVQRELEHWLEHESPAKVLIVLTDGEIACDPGSGTIDWARTTALPPQLRPVLASVPLYLDLRWARAEEHLSTRNPRFREAVAEITASLRGVPKDQLVGEDVRLYRRALRLAWTGVAALGALAAVAAWQAFAATQQRRVADEQRRVAEEQRAVAEERGRAALSRQLAAESGASLDADPTLGYRLAEAAVHVEPTIPAQLALFRAFDRQACFSRLTLDGHGALLSDAAFSPDGHSILTASYDFVSRVWDADTGRERSQFGDDEIRSAVFSRDGAGIFTVARRNRSEHLVLWDAAGGKVRAWSEADVNATVEQEFTAATGFSLGSLDDRQRVSPDGTRRLQLEDRAVVLLDERGEPICRLVGHQESVTSARFSFDGQRIVTASHDRTARVWELPTPQPRLPEPPQAARPASFEPTEGRVADASHGIAARLDSTSVALVETASGRVLRALVGHSGTIEYASFSPDGSQLVTSCDYGLSAGEFDTSVRVWDVATGRQLRQLPGTPMSPVAAFTPDGRAIVVNGIAWPATWRDVLEFVAEKRVRGVPRELTPAEKQQHGLDASVAPGAARERPGPR